MDIPMDQLEEYITPALECFEINLTRPSKDGLGEPVFSESFGPTHTYQFSGNDEQLIGYKEPTLQLSFRANDMKPSLKAGYEEKVELPDELYTERHLKFDFETPFKEYLSASVFDPSLAPTDDAQNDPTSKDWRPPGTQLHKFALHGKQYEIWATSFSDPAALKLWENMQILPMLYIEGASLPELDDEWSLRRWSLYLLYEVTSLDDDDTSPYTLAGFSTTYRFWTLPTLEIIRATKSLPSPPASSNGETLEWSPARFTQDPKTFQINEKVDPLTEPSRERISQYLILPPYQGQSLGATLYETIFADLVKKPYIHEITVEDPDEAFDAMRDYSDIVYLRGLSSFGALSIPTTIPKEKLAKDAPVPRDEILGNGIDLEKLRRETKIVPRQFNRMLELHLFSTIPPTHRKRSRITRKDRATNENDRKYYFWRLALKDRIYRQNRDSLDQMAEDEGLTAAEKVDMVEKAVDRQQEEFEERLHGLEKRAKWKKGAPQEGKSSRSKRKRVVVDDDEEDEWEDMDEDSTASSKKPRV